MSQKRQIKKLRKQVKRLVQERQYVDATAWNFVSWVPDDIYNDEGVEQDGTVAGS